MDLAWTQATKCIPAPPSPLLPTTLAYLKYNIPVAWILPHDFTSPIHCYFIVLGTETMTYLSSGKPCNLLILYHLHSDAALIFFFSSLPFSLQVAHRHRQGKSLAMLPAWLVYFLPLVKCLWLNTGFFSSPRRSSERRGWHIPGIKGSVTIVLECPSCRKPRPLLSDYPAATHHTPGDHRLRL